MSQGTPHTPALLEPPVGPARSGAKSQGARHTSYETSEQNYEQQHHPNDSNKGSNGLDQGLQRAINTVSHSGNNADESGTNQQNGWPSNSDDGNQPNEWELYNQHQQASNAWNTGNSPHSDIRRGNNASKLGDAQQRSDSGMNNDSTPNHGWAKQNTNNQRHDGDLAYRKIHQGWCPESNDQQIHSQSPNNRATPYAPGWGGVQSSGQQIDVNASSYGLNMPANMSKGTPNNGSYNDADATYNAANMHTKGLKGESNSGATWKVSNPAGKKSVNILIFRSTLVFMCTTMGYIGNKP